MLALIAAGAPLVDTVTAVARLVERHAGVAEVTIQVVGDDGEPVVAGTAPPLPSGLMEALGGRGGRRRGALFADGRHERRTVVVEDIRVTEVGERYRALVDWIGKSLAVIPPDYGIEYEPPSAAGAIQPRLPAAGIAPMTRGPGVRVRR